MTTTADRAYYSIREMLLERKLLPGQQVSQTRIARMLSCSTVPVVEALRRLESEGILKKVPRKMARVRVLKADELESLFLLRQSLEMTTARLCAVRRTEEAAEQLRDLEQRFRQAALQHDFDTAVRLDLEIHQQIIHAAQCPLLEREFDRLLLIQRTLSEKLHENETWEYYTYCHQGIVQAIVDRDTEMAEFLMRKHIQRGYDKTLANLLAIESGRQPIRWRRKRPEANG